MRNVNLRNIMQSLYDENSYYPSIPPIHTDYEEAYHDVTIDPDGKKRYSLQEREHNLKGISKITD